MTGGAPAAGGADAGGLRHDRRLRRLRRHRRVGRGASDVPAPLPALPPWRSRRALADHPDEPHQPALFSAAFTRLGARHPADRPDLVAIDGKTSRRSHDRAAGLAPIHLVSAFATTSRLVLGQEAVPDKANELAPFVLLERLAEGRPQRRAGLHRRHRHERRPSRTTIRDAQADYLLAVKANQPRLRAEIEAFFAEPTRRPRQHHRSRQGPRPHRAAHRHRRPRGRLALRRRAASPASFACRMSPPSSASRHAPSSKTAAASRPAIMSPPPRSPPPGGRGCPWPLGHREQPALGARRHLRRRPVPPAKWARCPQYGRRPPLRHRLALTASAL